MKPRTERWQWHESNCTANVEHYLTEEIGWGVGRDELSLVNTVLTGYCKDKWKNNKIIAHIHCTLRGKLVFQRGICY